MRRAEEKRLDLARHCHMSGEPGCRQAARRRLSLAPGKQLRRHSIIPVTHALDCCITSADWSGRGNFSLSGRFFVNNRRPKTRLVSRRGRASSAFTSHWQERGPTRKSGGFNRRDEFRPHVSLGRTGPGPDRQWRLGMGRSDADCRGTSTVGTAIPTTS